MSVSRPSPFPIHRIVALGLLVIASACSVLLYRNAKQREHDGAETKFANRASLRHVLTREILGRYEDSLFGLSALFRTDSRVSAADFARESSLLQSRVAGSQAFEWVPFVPHPARASLEAEYRHLYSPQVFEVSEPGPEGKPRRASDRPAYYPILYVHPLAGNESALGYDLMTAPSRGVLDQAREARQMRVTQQFRLVQEPADKFGVVMAWPIYRSKTAPHIAGRAEAAVEEFAGFIQGVFRVHDLLETVHTRQPDTMLDMLFIDVSETELARRTLYYRPAAGSATGATVPEEEFRRGVHREFKIPFGQRDWRVIFRPRAGWMEDQHTFVPLFQALSVLLLAGLAAGLAEFIGMRAVTIKREVTARTAELTESRRQVANMLHALPGMSFRCTYDEQLSVLFISDGAFELTGWTAEEFMSGRIHFRDCIHPEDLNRVRESTRTALQERKDFEIEYRICLKAGGEKWVLSRGRGVYGTDGALDLIEGLAIDITAQKKAEAARLSLERKLLEGQKLESMGLLAGGIAHDFNNLLSAILGSASMARLSLTPGDPTEAPLRTIEAASLQAAELCRQMLAYAGKGQFVIEPTDISLLVEDVLPLLQGAVGRQSTLKLDLQRNLPPVRADATQIRQVVINLVLNAADAMRDRSGEINLTTGVAFADRAMLANCTEGAGLAQGDYVFLEVTDNGMGMTPDVMAKIFDPFFSTKEGGRGLGLAAVLGIVRGHFGAMCVQSRPREGSKFRLLLPPAPSAPSAARPAAAAPDRPRRDAVQVMVVEDEEQVRHVTTEMLKLFGHAVTAVADGHAAVALYRENPGRFDLVVLDLIMPGLSGEQTLAALRVLNPDVRVLLTSGYGEEDILRRLGKGPALGFLSKPFTRETLEKGLRGLLG